MLAKKLESAAKAVESAYIEDVFSTYLYTGNGASLTINNGIDLAGKGGLVWAKDRTFSAESHYLVDTVRGGNKSLNTDTNTIQNTNSEITTFNSNGYTLASNSNVNYSTTNPSPHSYVSWTFRKQPKFFDVVTYTGDGTTSRNIAHSLASVPGCIIVKRTDSTGSWPVQHTALAANAYLYLEQAVASATVATSSAHTSTTFNVGTSLVFPNANGATYVAYLFAHNAGGFGLTGSDNVITCGSYTGNGSTTGPVVTLGYEPQWLLIKSTSNATDWYMVDTMRGFWTGDTSTTLHDLRLKPNTADAEGGAGFVIPLSTGFQLYGANAAAGAYNGSGSTYIYIAIRRGPMKVPTTGTSVFSPVAYSGNNSIRTITAGFPIDVDLNMVRSSAAGHPLVSRLTGGGNLDTADTSVEGSGYSTYLGFDNQTGLEFKNATGYSYYNSSANTYVAEMFRRSPGFFDEVCYTGTGSNLTVNHNLGVVPELMILKARSNLAWWPVYCANVSLSGANVLGLNYADAAFASSQFNGAPTSTTFQLVNSGTVNTAGQTQVAYLFASCPGVSKVGSYTGNGSSQTINCGFTGGARFVLIKRTDSTGDWYVWDTARGIVSGNDPHLSLNTTDAEVTTDDTIDPDSTGFIVNQLAATNVNVSSATYIYLAIA